MKEERLPQNHIALLTTFRSGSPRDEAAHVVQQHRQVPLGDARRIAGHVRRQDDAFVHAPQRMIGRQRLRLEDVQGRPGDLPGLQGRRQVGQIDDGSAADVDEVGRRASSAGTAAGGTASPSRGVCGAAITTKSLCAQQVGQPLRPPQRRHAGRRLASAPDRPPRRASPKASARRAISAPMRAQADDAERAVGQVQVGAVDGVDDAGPGREADALRPRRRPAPTAPTACWRM